MKFFRRHHSDFVLTRVIHVVGVVKLTSQADLQNIRLCQQALLNRTPDRGSVRILHAPVLIPSIGMRIQLDQSNRTMGGVNASKNRQQARMIATHTYGRWEE